ncbi:MAG: DUF1853 family protein [Flavobacteriaceae bacterium]|nr:DUF1853 family protein [Flavobacteriaceae bacterium]
MEHTNEKLIHLQYQGFGNTHHLWDKDAVYGLSQLDVHNIPQITLPSQSSELPKRLGKRVESFALHQLSQLQQINIIAKNIHIRADKHTIGELDAIISVNGQPVHLEIIYKFYLYDASVGTHELEHWIGPNRNDSLVQKLDKLKEKQLPLLYHPETKKYLDQYQLDAKEIDQKVLFKAQLFTPPSIKQSTFKELNSNCIAGNYYTKAELSNLETCQFYMPIKNNWLIAIPKQTSWIGFQKFSKELDALLQNKRAPLVWIKHPQGATERAFVVWW